MWTPKSNPLQDKSFSFAQRIVRVYTYLTKKRKEFVMSTQLLRSGTSVGANIEEALQAQSKKDFIPKLYISLKEAYESHYWIRLLQGGQILTEKESTSLLKDVNELIRIITAIIKTTKSNIKK
jgi:four helix bundle protein